MKGSAHFRLPFLQIFGVLIIITGVFLMWRAYNEPEQKKIRLPENNSSSEEEDGDTETYYSAVRERSGSAKRIGTAIIGGLMILGAVPMFYVPYTSDIFKFRKRKDRDKKQDSEENEFDESDFDNFDFDGYYTLGEYLSDIEINESVMDMIKRNYKKDNKK